MRPPQAVPEATFLECCDGCGDCARACAEGVIKRGDDGRASIAFGNGECTFCHDCTPACPTGALDATNARHWGWVAQIGSRCLSLNGVTCRACEDCCPTGALRFRPAPGGRVTAALDRDACTGCGGCAAVCPATTITFHLIAPKPAEAQC